MRVDWHLARHAVGLCLPTIAVVALSIFFYFDKLPEIVKSEHDRIREAYREKALEIRQDPSGFQSERAASWGRRSIGKMSPGKWGFQVAVPPKGITFVWYEKDGVVHYTTVEAVSETDYRTLFTLFGSFFLLVLVGVTVVGIRYFVRYMKSRDDFLAATAHDLTTPLVGMRRMIGRNDDEARNLNERMILLVNNIKEFLKLGGRRKEPDLKSVDIVALTHEAYSLFSADYADSEGGPVVFNNPFPVPSSPFPRVMVDETMTLQILWNLFGNDLKYAAPYGKVEVRFVTDKEGEEKRPQGEARTPPLRRCGVSPHQSQCPAIIPNEKNVTVEFADEGPGMSARQMRKAFDRYYRAKTVLVSGKGGFGIGLCTAREFARAMGGDLTVRPNVPHGCIFALRLPRV